jgi:hypothetical protein
VPLIVIFYFFVFVCRSATFVCQVCFAMAINVCRPVVCWNHIDGVAAHWASPRASLGSSLHMVLTPCRRFCGEFVTNEFVCLGQVGWFVPRWSHWWELCFCGIPRSSWAACRPSLPKWPVVTQG